MNKIIKLIFLITLISFSSHAFVEEHVPKNIPYIKIYDLKGKEFNIEKLEGNVLVLHFWATWCPNCLKEMESLNALQKILKKEPIIVIPISEDFKGVEVVEKFYHSHDLKNLVGFIDPNNKVFQQLKLVGLPSTFIIDSSGKKVAAVSRPIDWTEDKVIKFLRKHVSNKLSDNQDYINLVGEQKIFDDTTSEENKLKEKISPTLSASQVPVQGETYVAPKNSDTNDEQEINVTNITNNDISFKIKRPVNSSKKTNGDKND